MCDYVTDVTDVIIMVVILTRKSNQLEATSESKHSKVQTQAKKLNKAKGKAQKKCTRRGSGAGAGTEARTAERRCGGVHTARSSLPCPAGRLQISARAR